MKHIKHFTWRPAWLQHYQRDWLVGDLSAGFIVTVMLIPQSLAYALLAGLPLELGLYASILPLIVYSLLGTSMTLSVGPVAVISFMTATSLAPLATVGSAEYIVLAGHLAMLSGLMLLIFGILRLGFFAYFLSHPVISGFISGSAVLIATGQFKHILGVQADGETAFELLQSLSQEVQNFNSVTLMLGMSAIVLLQLSRRALPFGLRKAGLSSGMADIAGKITPLLIVIFATALVFVLELADKFGVKVVGSVPAALPTLNLSFPDSNQFSALLLPALIIALVGFVESVSVAQSLALKRRQRIKPDGELIALGAANMASAMSGAFPVTGGFSRSVVNFDAGANTPLSGIIAATLMLGVVAGLTGLFQTLPHAVLAATIIVAVISLIDFKQFNHTWRYDRADAVAMLATAFGVIVLGVEVGILIGVVLSLSVFVWRSSRPHMAVVGRMPGTEHFRNVKRHDVETLPGVIALRIDESLFFGNAHAVEDQVVTMLAENEAATDLILSLSAVNRIDATALQMLTDLNRSLKDIGIRLHLAEIKGPSMDRLKQSVFLQELSGKIFLGVNEAFQHLDSQNKSLTIDPTIEYKQT